MTLGEFIDTMAALPGDAEVVFDFGTIPTWFASWRGVYAQLTLNSKADAEPITVAQLLKTAQEADGDTFEGYKGGDFEMDRNTALWADQWGEYTGRMLLGAVLSGDKVVLRTMVQPSEYRY